MATNGKLATTDLRTVIGVPMLKTTANAVDRLVAEAKKDGVTITSWAGYGGYRDLDLQRAMKTTKNPAAYGMSVATQKLLSAIGGSPHGLGRAIDFRPGTNNVAKNWLIKNAGEFGFSRPMATNDPNHWVHDGKTGITPMATPTATQRVTAVAVNKRASASSKSADKGAVQKGATIDMVGYEIGELVSGIDEWFKGKDGFYYWAGAFTNKTINGLSNLKPPVVTPPVVTPPVTPPVSPVVIIAISDEQIETIISEVVERVKPLIPTADQIAKATRAAIIK